MDTAAHRTSAPRAADPIVANEIRARLGDTAGRTDTPATSPRALTNREQDVVRGVVAGLGKDQIARRPSISRGTVLHHVRRVMQKWVAAPA